MDDPTPTELEERRRRALALGGPEAIVREHERGRLTVRERIDRLVDPGSFREIGTLTTLPVVDVWGEVTATLPAPYVGGVARIDGRQVIVGGEDFTVNYGAPAQHLEKLKGGFSGFIEELAHEFRLPLVLLLHGAGGDVGFADAIGFNPVPSLHSVFPMAELLDLVPVATAVLGVVGGGAGARAVASHFSVMSRPQGMMFAAGPAIVARALGRPVGKEELGGVEVHVTRSGNVDNIAEDEDDAFHQIRRFLSFLPPNVEHLPPVAEPGTPEAEPLTDEAARVDIDPLTVISGIVDSGSWFPMSRDFGPSLVTGLARIAGRTVGILAHDPTVADGAMDGLAADKQTRFVQVCDTFHVPMVFLVNTTGVRADADAEASGVLRRALRALHAVRRARTPILSIQIGRCDGLSGMATNPADRTALRVAWPSASFGNGGDLSTASADDGSPWATAEGFGIEEVIRPGETRAWIADWLTFSAEANRPGAHVGQQYRP